MKRLFAFCLLLLPLLATAQTPDTYDYPPIPEPPADCECVVVKWETPYQKSTVTFNKVDGYEVLDVVPAKMEWKTVEEVVTPFHRKRVEKNNKWCWVDFPATTRKVKRKVCVAPPTITRHWVAPITDTVQRKTPLPGRWVQYDCKGNKLKL